MINKTNMFFNKNNIMSKNLIKATKNLIKKRLR